MERSKQQQMMELEKRRLKFTNDLEFHIMNMFMDTQLEFQRMKRPQDTEMGTVKINIDFYIWGNIINTLVMHYKGGESYLYEDFDINLIFVPHFVQHVKSKGYKNDFKVWYKFEDEEIQELKLFDSDAHVVRIIERFERKEVSLLQLYVDHVVETNVEVLDPIVSSLPSPHQDNVHKEYSYE